MAQRSARVPSVVVLTPYEEAGKNVFTPISRGAFDRALRELSWIDGHNIRIDYRDAGGDLELLRKHSERVGETPTRRNRCCEHPFGCCSS